MVMHKTVLVNMKLSKVLKKLYEIYSSLGNQEM